MREYSREEKRELSKRYNNGEFELFSKEEKLALALWQVEILNKNSNLDHVREAWEKWNKLSKVLIVELLQESIEVPTNKGIRKVLNINGNTATICKECNGTKINHQRKDNKCHCVRGWFWDDKLKIIGEEEYKKRASKKYFKILKKKRLLTRYSEEELLKMNMKDFLYITKITTL